MLVYINNKSVFKSSPIYKIEQSVMEIKDEADTDHMVSQNMEKKNEPINYVLIVLFYFLGTTCYLPSSFYVTANGYWMFKFRDPNLPFNTSDIQKTTLQKNFTAYTSIAGNVGTITFLFVTFALVKKISLKKRIIGGMVSLLMLFVLTWFFIFLDTDSWQSGFFVIAVGTGGLLHCCFSVLLISFFQLSARFPLRYLAAQLAGQSVCGILAASVQVFALLVTSSVKVTAGLFYAIAVFVIGGTIIAFVVISNKSEYLRNKLEWTPAVVERPAAFNIGAIIPLLKKLWLLLLALSLCLVSTLILNPGLTALIESSGKGTNVWSDTYFVPVTVFLLFNVMEFFGREISNYVAVLKIVYVILGTSVVRLVLFPLILLCNIQPRNHLPVVFHEDACFIIFMILLAFSSGYVQNVVIIILPGYCEREEKIMCMFTIMFVMLVFATIASILSGVVVNLI